MGILGKLVKGAAIIAGKVIITAHDPRKFGTERQYIARNIENKVTDAALSKLAPYKGCNDLPEGTGTQVENQEMTEEYIVFKKGEKDLMKTFKLVIKLEDESKVWINVNHIVKMTKTKEGNYYIYLINGDKYLIDHRTASAVESCFEG